ncbi:MAG TPA: nitrite reductase small subunit NirD [Polyangiaceae bacterium]|nr:nitrite reductase small subunit NirD [Polyangiaceae bacterium]
MTAPQRKHATVVHNELEWHDACLIDDVAPGSGLSVSVGDEQIAIVRTHDGLLAALSNFDPFSKACVIARGIVGEYANAPTITSPIYLQSFYLETGECLEDRSTRLSVFPVRVWNGQIQVALSKRVTTR